MNRALLRRKIKRWAYPVAAVFSGVAEVIRQDPEFYLRSWHEILNRGLKVLPVVLFGLGARFMLSKKDDDEDDSEQDQMVPGERRGRRLRSVGGSDEPEASDREAS